MSVYVDPLFRVGAGWGYGRYKEACHLFADSAEELHAFAKKIGLRRAWAQRSGRDPGVLHYDLTKGMRHKALVAGARALDRREAGEFIQKAREGKPDARR